MKTQAQEQFEEIAAQAGLADWHPGKHPYYLMPEPPPRRFWLDPTLSGRPALEADELRGLVEKIDADAALTQAERVRYVKLRGLADLFFFGKVLCGHDWLSPELHGPLAWAWQAPDGYRSPLGVSFDRYRLAVIARSHLKTTLLTQDSALFDAVRDTEERILIFTHSLDFTADVMSPIKALLEGDGKGAELFAACYGDLIPNEKERGRKYKWDQLNLTLKRKGRYTDATIKGRAVGASATGTHSTKQYVDDLVKEEVPRSQMDKIIKAFMNLTYCYHSLKLGQRRMVGTPWGFWDPIVYANRHWPNTLVARLPWRRPNGALLFDKCDVPEALRVKKADPWFFSCQFEVWPKDDEKMGFRQDWFKYFRVRNVSGVRTIIQINHDGSEGKRIPIADCNVFVLIDPNTGRVPGQKSSLDSNAPKSSKLDYAGFITMAVDRDNNRYILSAIRRRVNPSELVNLTFELVGLWSPKKVIIEQRAAQILFIELFAVAFRGGRKPFILDDFEGGHASKDERIKGLIPFYQNGMIYHREGGGPDIDAGMIALEGELIDFGGSPEFDDLMDAESASLKKCYPPGANANTFAEETRDERFEGTIAHLDKSSRREARNLRNQFDGRAIIKRALANAEFFTEG